MATDYLSDAALSNLRYYKYSAVDQSLIARHVLQGYWSWAVTLFPMWMAPNLITLIGLCFVIANLVITFLVIPDFESVAPSWVYFSYAAGLWLYSTFDNVDGKQARRTGTSSPLGELFDHGCDALNSTVGTLVQAAALGLGNTWRTVVLLLTVQAAFFVCAWEEYHTGTLYLGVINGPTEGLLIAIAMCLVSGIQGGPFLWHRKLIDLLPNNLTTYVPSFATVADAGLVWLAVMFFVATLPVSLVHVIKATRSKKAKSSTLSALAHLVPVTAFFCLTVLWLAAPGSILLHKRLALFSLANGIVFGRIVTKVILAHLTRMPYPATSTAMIIPLLLGTAIANAPYFNNGVPLFTETTEYYYVLAYFALAVVNYAHWALLVIRRFCKHLGINCLTIKRNSNSNKSSNNNKSNSSKNK